MGETDPEVGKAGELGPILCFLFAHEKYTRLRERERERERERDCRMIKIGFFFHVLSHAFSFSQIIPSSHSTYCIVD